jgi:hypothetical protein
MMEKNLYPFIPKSLYAMINILDVGELMRGFRTLTIALIVLMSLLGIASAAVWIETTASDFSDGTLNDVVIVENLPLDDGSIILAKENDQYKSQGIYTSNIYDTKKPRNYNALAWVSWDIIKPDSTSVKFQINTSYQAEDGTIYTTGFLGPDGSSNSWYEHPGVINSIHDGYSQIQYRAKLETLDPSKTPKLRMVIITYSNKPVPPVPELATWMLLTIGLAGFIGLARFRRQ